VGGLLISGDLTWRSARDEFEWAAKFIRDITSWAKLTASLARYSCVPATTTWPSRMNHGRKEPLQHRWAKRRSPSTNAFTKTFMKKSGQIAWHAVAVFGCRRE